MLIDNGKKPDEPYNAALGFWLPSDSPYGNFQLKYMKIVLRLDEANRRINESQIFWSNCRTGSMPFGTGSMPFDGAYERHIFANEEVIYMLRRAADELVSLVWCLSQYEENGDYPRKIKIDCLGAVTAQDESVRHEVFSEHVEIMILLNNISNAFKHSFINSNHTLLGVEEPMIHALGFAYNKLSSQPEFYDVSLKDLMVLYNEFYNACISWLKSYSERNR